MVKKIKFTAEAFEKYIDGLSEKFDTTIVWNTLLDKSEYGSDKSERAYQILAISKATSMARRLGLNISRVSFYVKCLGSAFPAYGREGRKRIEEYAAICELPYEEKEVMASVIEESFAQSGKFVVEGLREILLELFDKSNVSSIKEVELAKLYHEEMEVLKLLDTSSNALLENQKRLDEMIEKNIDKLDISEIKKMLIDEKKSLEANTNQMYQNEIEKYYKLIDQYYEYAKEECLINFILHAKNNPEIITNEIK